jgi:hypothetical protein
MNGESNYKFQASQIMAVKAALELAKVLQKDLPQIAQSYTNLVHRRDIVLKYAIGERYGVSDYIAKQAVLYAIRGYEGNLVESFRGLIDDKFVLEELCFQHRSISTRNTNARGVGFMKLNSVERRKVWDKSDATQRRNGTGLYGLTTEQRKILGKKATKTNRENGTGFYGFTKEEQSDNGKRGALAQGSVLFTRDELTAIANYHSSEDFFYTEGNHIGQPNLSLITDQINIEFHSGKNVRSVQSISTAMRKQKKLNFKQNEK